jgi:hypothetical protein
MRHRFSSRPKQPATCVCVLASALGQPVSVGHYMHHQVSRAEQQQRVWRATVAVRRHPQRHLADMTVGPEAEAVAALDAGRARGGGLEDAAAAAAAAPQGASRSRLPVVCRPASCLGPACYGHCTVLLAGYCYLLPPAPRAPAAASHGPRARARTAMRGHTDDRMLEREPLLRLLDFPSYHRPGCRRGAE